MHKPILLIPSVAADRDFMPVAVEFWFYRQIKFSEIPPAVLELALLIFEAFIPSKTKIAFRDAYKAALGRPAWFDEAFGHFRLGMKVRNLLRENYLTDDLVPDGNLDDYYVPMLERWIGVR